MKNESIVDEMDRTDRTVAGLLFNVVAGAFFLAWQLAELLPKLTGESGDSWLRVATPTLVFVGVGLAQGVFVCWRMSR